jgi:hypothetical protein
LTVSELGTVDVGAHGTCAAYGERADRLTRRLKVPLLFAALLTIPALVIE